jgi:hypothetical protein
MDRRMKLLVLMSTALLGACATSISPASKADPSRAMAFPLRLSVDKDASELAWGRAQAFVGRFSSMKLQVATDCVIQTYNATDDDEYSHYATRTPSLDRDGF